VSLESPPVNVLTADLMHQLTATINILGAASSSGGPASVESVIKAQYQNSLPPDSVLQMLRENFPTGIVLRSGVKNCFSAGLDLDFLASTPNPPTPEVFTPYWNAFQDAWRCLQCSPIPVIASIEGNAAAGGCILATCCDARVMARHSLPEGPEAKKRTFRIGVTAVKCGFPAPTWTVADLTRVVGAGHAEYLLCTGALLPADDALTMGLLNKVVETPSECTDVAVGMLKEYSCASKSVYWHLKETFRSPVLALLPTTPEGRAADTQIFYESITNPIARDTLVRYRQSIGKRN